MKEEMILVVRRSLLESLGVFQGFTQEVDRYLPTAKASIGIGGHMNDQDEGLFALDRAAYLTGVQREIDEEIQIPNPRSHRIVGLINDDSTEVGRVHLGVVHVLQLPAAGATKRESAITEVEFLTPAELRAERESLETWSQICLDHLQEILDS